MQCPSWVNTCTLQLAEKADSLSRLSQLLPARLGQQVEEKFARFFESSLENKAKEERFNRFVQLFNKQKNFLSKLFRRLLNDNVSFKSLRCCLHVPAKNHQLPKKKFTMPKNSIVSKSDILKFSSKFS